MLKKLIATFKFTIIILVCILIPLFVGGKLMKSAAKTDARRCVDSFIHTEGVGLAKYMAIQFKNTEKHIRSVAMQISHANTKDPKTLKSIIKTVMDKDSNVAAIHIYDESGKFLTSSSNKTDADLTKNKELDKLKDEIIYKFRQEEDKTVVVEYTSVCSIKNKKNKSEKLFFELDMKWNQYETYMHQMEQGSFPRMFYIISPDCRRYISMNALPSNKVNYKNVVALGMHLAQKINDVSIGLSDVDIASFDFRVFKKEVEIPKELDGSKLFVVVAADDETLEILSANMFAAIPNTIMILIAVWLIVCVVIARFYTKMRDQLEIAEVISDSTPLAIVIFKSTDGKIMKINLTATTLLRIEKENIPNIDMWNLFIEEDDKKYVHNAVFSNIKVLNYEVLVQSFGGGNFWSICSASPIDIEDEKYIVLAILDINRRKEIEKKLANNAALLERQVTERTADLESKAKELEKSNALFEKAKLMADEANKAKTKFLTNMSNELKTPINAIIGYSEILEEEANDRKDNVTADDLRKIIGSAKHLLSLIEEILNLSTIEAGKTQLFFENFDVMNLIKDVEGVTMPLIAKNDNSLFMECPKDIGSMYSDSTKIRQCLLNLLSNAAKFTEFGKITLRVSPLVKAGEDFVEFSVIDTGIGIEADKIDSIFESFQENSNKNSGAGLGLSLTKKYSECLGGTITVESTVGGGSKFVIRIPRTCTVVSNEFIEVKNQNGEEIVEEEFNAEDSSFGEGDSDNFGYGTKSETNSFSRKSDQNTDDI